MPATLTLREAHGAVDASSGQLQIRLITPGVGSSGYYAPEVLEAAAAQRVFPAGTLMFVDHPTVTERTERPERSVKDVAAVLAEDATWDGSGLVALANPVGVWGEVVAEMAGAIGVSIRASGTSEMGEHDGRRMPIITSLDEGLSVDFVTYPGRGGSFEVMESVRPSAVTARLLERGIAETAANDTREALQTAISDAYRVADTRWAWVRDYDPDAGLVYFELSGDENGTFQQSFALNADGTASLSGDRVEVNVRTTYVPVDPAGQSTTTESQGGTMPEIEEARLRQLETDAGRVPELVSERDTAVAERDAATRRLAEHEARQAARPIVAECLAGAQLPASTIARVTEALVTSAPLTDTGGLDETALRTAATAARTSAEAEIAEALGTSGAGTVRGFGVSTPPGEFDESGYDTRSGRVFGRPQIVKGA